MNKVIGSIFASLILFLGSIGYVGAQEITLSQLIEIFIQIGIIPVDKVGIARAIASQASTLRIGTTNTSATSTNQYLSIILPNTGNLGFEVGREMLIRWDARDVGAINIGLISSNGTFYPIDTNVSAARGSNFNWIIPAYIPAGFYKLSLTTSTVSDTSDEYFKIIPSATTSGSFSVSVSSVPWGKALVKAGSSWVLGQFSAAVSGGSGNYKASWTFDNLRTPGIDAGSEENDFSPMIDRNVSYIFNTAGDWNVGVSVRDDQGRITTGNLLVTVEQGV